MTFMSKIKQRFSSKRVAIASACALAVVAGAGLGIASKQLTSAATHRDCSTNSIDYKNMNGGCGAANPSEFIKDAKANSPSDLKAIYEHYGLAPSEYTRFVETARMGTVYKDGRVVVDGQTVATNAWSVGRHSWSGRKPVKINGKTYYTSPTSNSFVSNSIPAMVMFDKNGKMEFAVLTECGNPVPASPKTPTYACNALNKKAVSGKANTYSFTTNASAGNGAKIAKVEYDFGDGSAKVTKTNPGDAVTHTFTKSADVTVKVYVNVPGKKTIVVQSVKCKTHVEVEKPKPEMACKQLIMTPGKADEQGNVEYTLAASAAVKNATIQSYAFTFGDNNAQIVTTNATSATTKHTYAPGTYTAKVVVKVMADGKSQDVTSESCAAQITIKQPECKPGVPVGSPECLPPEMACVSLVMTPAGPADTNGKVAYTLAATASVKNATIQSYAFTFGDETPVSTVQSSATTASVTHTYAPGPYTAKVTVSMTADGKTQNVTSEKCEAKITVSETPKCEVPGKENLPPDSPECKEDEKCTAPNGQTYPKGAPECEVCTAPNGQTYPKGSEQCETCTAPNGQTYPKGSKECEVCTSPTGQTYPAGSEECKPKVLAAATELPSTGPGQVAAVFAGASIAGVIAHRWYMRRRFGQNQ